MKVHYADPKRNFLIVFPPLCTVYTGLLVYDFIKISFIFLKMWDGMNGIRFLA